MKRTSNGVTLMEIIVAIGLMLLGLSLAFVNFKKTHGDSRAAAQILASEFKAARQMARSHNEPVAVAFPTNAGTVAHSESFLIFRGWTAPSVIRGFSLQADAPNTAAFLGQWYGTQTGLERNDLDGVTFDLATWNAPTEYRYVVFLPSGIVQTDLPTFDNAVHVVALDGVTYAPAGGENFLLLAAANPYTIVVQADGRVSVKKGVVEGDSTVGVATSGAFPGAAATATPPSSGGNAPPVVKPPSLFPGAHPTYRPPGADATVKLDGFCSLKVEATDPDGDRLFCEWTAEIDQQVVAAGRKSLSGPGLFSAEGRTEMEWNSLKSQWETVRQWTPPPEAIPGDRFVLTYHVYDEKGAETSGSVGVTGVVEVLPQGRILFHGRVDDTDHENFDIFAVNADGTDFTQLTNHPKRDYTPRWSPDGSRIVFVSNREGPGKSAIYTMNADGSNIKSLIGQDDITPYGLSGLHDPIFDPTGTMIAFVSIDAVSRASNVYVVSIDGTVASLNPSTDQPIGHEVAPGAKIRRLGNSGMIDNEIPYPDPTSDSVRISEWHANGRYILLAGGRSLIRFDYKGNPYEAPSNIYLLDTHETGSGTGDGYTQITNPPPNQVNQEPHFNPLGADGSLTGPDEIYWDRELSPSISKVHSTVIDLTSVSLTHALEPGAVVPNSPAGTAFSPDGVFLVGGSEVTISLADGTRRTQLTDTGIAKGYMSWALNGVGSYPY